MPKLLVSNPASTGSESVPLLFDFQQEAQDFLDKFQRIDDLIHQDTAIHHSSWQTNPVDQGSAIGLPLINWPDQPPLRLNQLYWPTGASRFAYGMFLATGEQVRKIKELACVNGVEQQLTITAETDSAAMMDQLWGETPRTVEFKMYLLSPARISGCHYIPGGEDLIDPNGVFPPGDDECDYDLFILPFVDARWWWQFRSVPDPCGHSTWSSLIDSIVAGLGVTLEEFSAYSTYDTCGPHRTAWARYYHNAAQLLDAALASIGQRLIARYNGTFRAENGFDAATTFTSNIDKVKNVRDQLAGGECDDIVPRQLPEAVEVLFPKASCGLLCGYCDGAGCVEDYYRIEVKAEDVLGRDDACVRSGTFKTFHVRGYADMACNCESGTPANLATLTALATRIATDWYALVDADYDFTFVGPFDWTPCAFDDHVLFKFGIEYDDHLTAYATSVQNNAAEQVSTTVILNQERRRDYTTRVQSWQQNVWVDCLLLDTCVGERTNKNGMATALECILPGDTTGAATLAATATASSCQITIDNSDCLIFALPGDTFPVVYDDDCSYGCKWRPAGQFGTTRWVRIRENINVCGSGTGYVLEDASDDSSGGDSSSGDSDCEMNEGCCTMVESECEITVCNTTDSPLLCHGTCVDVLATLIPGKTCAWYVHPRPSELVEGCLAENHPGYGETFTINLMVWDKDNNGHKPDPNDTGTHYAIDWRYGTTYPDAGARGLFKPRIGYCDGEYVCIYEVVSLDCEVPPIDCTEAEVASCP